MQKIIALAAAAALISTTAQAASITIVLNGKSPEQVSAEIARAAHTVCVLETPTGVFYFETRLACEKEIRASAMAEAQAKIAKLAERTQLAKR